MNVKIAHVLLVRVVGIMVILFSVVHLYLNSYIMAAHFAMSADDLRLCIAGLSKTLGPVAIPEDMTMAVFIVKVLASLSFLAVGTGILRLKGWARRPLIALLALRGAYGVFICFYYGRIFGHLWLLLLEWALITYLLTRPAAVRAFAAERRSGFLSGFTQ
jgi:hypothetical protein